VDRPLIAELAGLPGAGKTTIAARLAAPRAGARREQWHLSGAGQPAVPRTAPAHPPEGALVTLGSRLALWCFALSAGRPDRARCGAVREFVRVLRRYDAARATRPPQHALLGFDQGLVQLLASIAMPSARWLALRALVRAAVVPRVDALVWVECDLDTAFARLRARPRGASRLDCLPDPDVRRGQRTMDAVLRTAVAAAADLGVPVLRVAAADPAERNAAAIAAWIGRLRAGPGPPA
jgi:hypothetical protein